METKTRKSVAPFYAVAVLWLVCGLLLPLYAPLHYILLAAVSAVVFFGVNAFCRNAGVIGSAEEAPKKAEPKKTSFSRPQFKKPAYQRCEFKTVDFIFLRRGVMSVNKIGYV